jgi:predicted ATPase
MDAQQRRIRTFEGLRQLLLLQARRHALVIVIEDLHWIDKTSEEFLTFFAESVVDAPVLLLMTCRPGYRDPFTERVERLTLGPLNDSESLQLASGALAGVRLPRELERLISSKAEGNPFFVEEIIRALLASGTVRINEGQCEATGALSHAQVPDTIQGVIMSRIDRLDAASRAALQLASVIGREFSVRLLRALAELDQPLGECLARLKALEFIDDRLLLPEPICAFRHVLTQEVAYNSLLVQRRREQQHP